MKTQVRIWLWICLLTAMNALSAQDAELDSIVILGYRMVDSFTTKNLPHSADMKASLLLSTSAVIQQQGANALATIIHRGLPSKAFGILHHGLRLNSITNNTFDVNLVPTFYFDHTTINTGGGMDRQAFAAPAGTMELGLQRKETNQMVFGARYQHIGNKEVYLKSGFSTPKLKLNLGGNVVDFDNRFSFIYRNIQQNSDVNFTKGYHVLADFEYLLGGQTTLRAGGWWLDFDRQLPGVLHRASDQRQKDSAVRTYLSIHKQKGSHQFNLDVNYAKEGLTYTTTSLFSEATTHAIQAIANAKFKSGWKHSLGWRFDQAYANFFTSSPIRSDLFYSLHKTLEYKKSNVKLTAIQHRVGAKWMPLQIEFRLSRKHWYFDLVRNYNLPGFNDLYWPLGGNPNLKTETSMQYTLGWKSKLGQFLNGHIHIYSYQIQNFIQWLPVAGESYWSPINVQQIHSRGVEAGLNWESNLGKVKMNNQLHYQFTKSTYEGENEHKGRQLIYVPLHKFNHQLQFQRKSLAIIFQSLYIGQRFETTDNSSALHPVLINNLKIRFQHQWNNIMSVIDAGVDNVFRANYEWVNLFPQPLSQWRVGVKMVVDFDKNSKQ